MSAPAPGHPWPNDVKQRALTLLREHGNATLARRALLAELGEGNAPSRSTLLGWAQAAGIPLRSALPPTERPVDTERDTGPATAMRTELDAIRRLDLSRLLRDQLARPAAELIARRLANAPEDEELVETCRRSYLDAARMERHAEEFGQDEVRAARRRTHTALLDLKVAETVRIDTRDLVGITTRAVFDHLRLEQGLDGDEDNPHAPITVVFDVEPDDEPAPQEVH